MTIRGYDDDRRKRNFIIIALIGGIIAGFALNGIVMGAIWPESEKLFVVSTPNNIGAGKITNVTFLAFGNGAALSEANITVGGAAQFSRGSTDKNGMLVLSVNATSNGSINVTAEKQGFRNTTTYIIATPGLDIVASPAYITTGAATFVTFSVMGMGKPVSGTMVNLSGAGIALDGVTNSNGEIIIQVNATETGKIIAAVKRSGYTDGSTFITSTGQQILSVSSSHSTVTINVPTYVTFTVTAGGSPVADVMINLSGAATGSGITNNDGKTVILTTPHATGTIAISAGRTGYAGGSTTVTSASTQSLSIAASPTSIIAGASTYVTFTVTSGSNFVSDAAVTLAGAAAGNGVTNQNGQAIIQITSTGTGIVTASASKTGYTAGSATMSAAGPQTLTISASPSNITNGVPTYVTFTVTSGSSAVSGATVSVSGGGITSDGMTNSAGQVTLLLNAASSGTINAVAKKVGYNDAQVTLAR